LSVDSVQGAFDMSLLNSDSESRDSSLFFGNFYSGLHPDSASESLLYSTVSSSGEAGQSGASGQGLLVSGESSSQDSREMNHHNYHNYRTTAAAPADSEIEKLKQVELLKEKLFASLRNSLRKEAKIDTTLLMPEPILLHHMFQRRDYDGIIAMYTSKLRVLEPAGHVDQPMAGQVDQPIASSASSVASSRISASPQPDGPSQTAVTAPQPDCPKQTQTSKANANRQRKRRRSDQPRVQMRFEDAPRPDGKIPATREGFKSFLVEHVRKSPPTSWSIGGLNKVFQDAHPHHALWRSWLGTKTAEGWSNGGWITVRQILEEAFPNATPAELNSHVAEGPAPSGTIQRETSRAPRSYTTAGVYKFVSTRMTALTAESGCSKSDEDVCRIILGQVKELWPTVNIPKDILTRAWEDTKSGSSIEDIVKNLKMLQNSLSAPRGNRASAAPSGQPPTSPSFSVPLSAPVTHCRLRPVQGSARGPRLRRPWILQRRRQRRRLRLQVSPQLEPPGPLPSPCRSLLRRAGDSLHRLRPVQALQGPRLRPLPWGLARAARPPPWTHWPALRRQT
jgi:hypothetical protein